MWIAHIERVPEEYENIMGDGGDGIEGMILERLIQT